jgi:hypothetical protein
MDFPNLRRALDPSRMVSFYGTHARLKERQDKIASVSQGLRDSPFATFQEDQIEAWKQALSAYSEMVRSREELNRQKGGIVLTYSKVLETNSDLKILDKFYATALDHVTEQFLAPMEGSLSKAYEFIYQRQKQVRLSMEEYRGKKTIALKLHVQEGEQVFEEETDDEGFSAQTTLGTILLIQFIISAGLPRIVFFDESLSCHGDEPLQRFMALLQQFRDNENFTFVVVTHDRRRLETFADRSYFVKDGIFKEIPVPGQV